MVIASMGHPMEAIISHVVDIIHVLSTSDMHCHIIRRIVVIVYLTVVIVHVTGIIIVRE